MTESGNVEQGVVGVLGAGLMGSGIAALLCAAGKRVKVYDVDSTKLSNVTQNVKEVVSEMEAYKLAEPMRAAHAADYVAAIDGYSEFSDCTAVIEAVVEDAQVKQAVYAQLEEHLAPDALIASNTSNIVPSILADGMKQPQRFLVAHFWNPPHAVPLVEIVPHADTASEVMERTVSLIRRIGNEPVVLNKEVAGFVGNRLQYALLREALWIVENGVANPDEVDRVMTLSLGRRYATVGPFATADLGGLDTFLMISKQLMPQLASGTGPLAIMERVVAQGDTGTKSGRGFFEWSSERRQRVSNARNTDLLQRRKAERRD